MKKINRRDFLKFLSLLPAAYYLPKTNVFPNRMLPSGQQNIIILVHDAWSADNISLYGYPRKTTPFLEKLAEKAIVYHSHYAASNWTYPGTTGLLTGTHVWTHRGYSHTIKFLEPYREKNFFNLFDSHHRIAYTHNLIADTILKDMLEAIDQYKPVQELYVNKKFWLSQIFKEDYDVASVSWVRLAKMVEDGYANSLFLARLYELINQQIDNQELKEYPQGLPFIEEDNFFKPEAAIDWIIKQSSAVPQPFAGYFHLLPPHDPYRTSSDFSGTFIDDGYNPIIKPKHILANVDSEQTLLDQRRNYDEYVLLVDSEINRLYQALEKNNILENTWLIITSDHGEMFERGLLRHQIPTFHRPLVRVPLLILPPGQRERVDVFTPTSAIDLLPTLLHIFGKPIPDWLEGELLPPYNPASDPSRPIWSMDASLSSREGPWSDASVMLIKDNYKLTNMFGSNRYYEPLNGGEIFEMYDLQNDPEELENLYYSQPRTAQAMRKLIIDEMERNDVR